MMFLVVGLGLVVGIVAYYKWAFGYWKKWNLKCFEEPTIPFGNIKMVLTNKLLLGHFYKRMYDVMKSKGYEHAGAFAFFQPIYVIKDLDMIKTVLQRSFDHFSDRFYYVDEADHPFEANLIFVGGERWRYLRTKISPAFTPGKIRAMLDTILQCAYQMQTSVACRKDGAIDMKQTALCYFTDIIGACGYGLDLNSFKNPNSEFIEHGRRLLDFKPKFKLFKIGLKATFPRFYRWLGLKLFEIESYEFLLNIVKDAAKFRKHNNVVRKDLLQLLLEAEPDLNVEEVDNESSKSAALIQEMTGHVFAFFTGSFETSTATLTFCLYELATNLDIQEKLIDEVDRTLRKYDGKITYESVMDMKYMSQVLDETLRKYPPIQFLTRRCIKDCEMPGTGVTIEKGILVFFSVLGIHHDPEYYPDPEIFDPERFSEENKNKRVPFTYLPFGEGPRICPAYRFGLMQLKLGLIVLLQNYTFSVNKNMELPIQLDPATFTSLPKSKVLLDVKNRK